MIYWDYKSDDYDSDVMDILLFDWLPAIVIACVVTCVCMHFENGTIICAEKNCYLHEHSWVCYLGWCFVNTGAVMTILNIVEGIVGMPLIHNLIVLLFKGPFELIYTVYCRMLAYRAQKSKYNADVLSNYEKFIKGGKR